MFCKKLKNTTLNVVDWTDLPVDILILIARSLVSIEDYVSFCSVCKSWQSVTETLGKRPSLPPRFPWVMLPDSSMRGKNPGQRKLWMLDPPEETKDSQGREMRRFYSFSSSKIHEFELPEATRRACFGVGYGWLVTVGYDFQINILHPFSRKQIRLPHLLSFKLQYKYDEDFVAERIVHMFVVKIVLSENPSVCSSNFVAVAIYGEGRCLAFARHGDEAWTDIAVNSTCYRDVVHYNNMFYTLDTNNVLFICDLNRQHGPQTIQMATTPAGVKLWDQGYLVDSCGVLLFIARKRVEIDFGGAMGIRALTSNFLIFRLENCQTDSDHQYPHRWTEVKDLGGRALFLGKHVSTMLDSSKCVKSDCIYFADDDVEQYFCEPNGGGRDTGIFNVKQGSIEAHTVAEFHCPLSPPLWYI